MEAVIVNAKVAGQVATFPCASIEQDPIDEGKILLKGVQITLDKVYLLQMISIPKEDLNYYGVGQILPSQEEIAEQIAKAGTAAGAPTPEPQSSQPKQSNGNKKRKPRSKAKAKVEASEE